MAIQLTQAGDSLANVVGVGYNIIASSTSPVTITCWVRAPWSNATESLVGLYDEKQRAATGNSTSIQIGCRPGNLLSVWTWGGVILVQSPTAMTPYTNVWCMITYTFDGTTHRVYVNNTLAGTGTTTQLAGAFDRVYINGYTTGGAAETSTFQLDTYTSYNRALSLDEITTMYYTGGNRHGIVYGCMVRYEFDELAVGTGTTGVYNQTGYTNAYGDLAVVAPAGTTRVTYTAGYADANLRQPQG